jgi:hypothetical protein
VTNQSATQVPFLVVVQIETALDTDDPAAWAVFSALNVGEIEAIWWTHDGRNFGTEALGVFRWDSSAPGISEYRPGAYVPHPAWTRPRPEAD